MGQHFMEKGYDIWQLPFQAHKLIPPPKPTYIHHPHKLCSPEVCTHKMWEQHSTTPQEACEINDFESYWRLDLFLIESY